MRHTFIVSMLSILSFILSYFVTSAYANEAINLEGQIIENQLSGSGTQPERMLEIRTLEDANMVMNGARIKSAIPTIDNFERLIDNNQNAYKDCSRSYSNPEDSWLLDPHFLKHQTCRKSSWDFRIGTDPQSLVECGVKEDDGHGVEVYVRKFVFYYPQSNIEFNLRLLYDIYLKNDRNIYVQFFDANCVEVTENGITSKRIHVSNFIILRY